MTRTPVGSREGWEGQDEATVSGALPRPLTSSQGQEVWDMHGDGCVVVPYKPFLPSLWEALSSGAWPPWWGLHELSFDRRRR